MAVQKCKSHYITYSLETELNTVVDYLVMDYSSTSNPLQLVMMLFHNLIVAPPEPQSNLNSTYLSTRLMARKSPLAESSL